MFGDVLAAFYLWTWRRVKGSISIVGMGEDVVQWVECSPHTHKGSVPSIKSGMVSMPVIPALGRWRKEGPEFKITFIYTMSQRPA